MWPVIAAVGGALATGGANIIGSYMTSKAQRDINSENLDYQRDYNEQIFEREDTAYQRAVADARQAGLSPLAITGGAGAGGTASSPQSDPTWATGYQNSARAIGEGLQTGMAVLNASQAYEMNEAKIDEVKAQTALINAQAGDVSFKQGYLTKEQQIKVDQFVDNLSFQTKSLIANQFMTRRGQDISERIATLNRQMQNEHFYADKAFQKEMAKAKHDFDKEILQLSDRLKSASDAASQALGLQLEKEYYKFVQEHWSLKEGLAAAGSIIGGLGSFTSGISNSFRVLNAIKHSK